MAKRIPKHLNILKNNFYCLYDKILNHPHEIKIELTYDCNRNCDFCFNKNSKKDNYLAFEDIDKLITKIREEGIHRVRFTGGEPLKRTDIKKILRLTHKKGLYIKLNTNGDLLTNENLKAISNYCMEVLLPLHDKKDITNEFYKKIKVLKKKGLMVYISTIAIRKNIEDFSHFSDFIIKANPDLWFWNYPIPTKKELITWQDVQKLIKKIQTHPTKTKAIRFPLCKVPRKNIDRDIQGCKNCGPYDHLVVSPSGEVHICNSFQNKLGTLDDSLLKIWRENSIVQRFKTHKILPQECQKCKLLKKCYGGCRYSAYLHTKKLGAKHPLMKDSENKTSK